MNEASSSSSSLPQQFEETIEENKINFFSNDLHIEPESYNYYQQPDHRPIGTVPLQRPLIIDYQSAGVDNNHWCSSSIHQPLKKGMENPRKRVNDGSHQTNVNKKLKHQERMQEIGCVREKMPMRRSQKLADKITALQKLVSPYGKTDTASVLQEAHISINLLHHKIQGLFQKTETSTNNLGAVQFQNNEAVKTGIHDRGLCLVPTSDPRINSLCFWNHNFMPRN
ncbi:hypothetical protein LXL04_012437 [Taraxacum kok-saghyz]